MQENKQRLNLALNLIINYLMDDKRISPTVAIKPQDTEIMEVHTRDEDAGEDDVRQLSLFSGPSKASNKDD